MRRGRGKEGRGPRAAPALLCAEGAPARASPAPWRAWARSPPSPPRPRPAAGGAPRPRRGSHRRYCAHSRLILRRSAAAAAPPRRGSHRPGRPHAPRPPPLPPPPPAAAAIFPCRAAGRGGRGGAGGRAPAGHGPHREEEEELEPEPPPLLLRVRVQPPRGSVPSRPRRPSGPSRPAGRTSGPGPAATSGSATGKAFPAPCPPLPLSGGRRLAAPLLWQPPEGRGPSGLSPWQPRRRPSERAGGELEALPRADISRLSVCAHTDGACLQPPRDWVRAQTGLCAEKAPPSPPPPPPQRSSRLAAWARVRQRGRNVRGQHKATAQPPGTRRGRALRGRHGLPAGAVDAPSRAVLEARLDGALARPLRTKHKLCFENEPLVVFFFPG